MTSFTTLNWDAPDVWGIVVGRGVSTVETGSLGAYEDWLTSNGYSVLEFCFAGGISPVVAQLGVYFRWQQQFGYELEADSRNLAALRDGFEIETSNLVFKLSSYESAIQEDEKWAQGFLSIVSEHSLRQLAVGGRFFAILPVHNAETPLVGAFIEDLCIPYPFRFRGSAA